MTWPPWKLCIRPTDGGVVKIPLDDASPMRSFVIMQIMPMFRAWQGRVCGMKRSLAFHICVALVWMVADADPLRADLFPDQVLVVYNSWSTDAIAVRDAYLAAHPDIPSANILDLNDAIIADVPDVSYSDFVLRIRDPIRNYIDTAGDPQAADLVSIVLIRGIPHRVKDTDIPTAGDSPTTLGNEFNAGDATAVSVDAELVLLWQDLDAGEVGGPMDSLADNVIDNPYHQSATDIQSFIRSNIQTQKSFFDIGDFHVAWGLDGTNKFRLTPGDMYLVCRIDAANATNAMAMVGRAQDIVVNRLYTRVILDKDGRANPIDDDGLFSPPVFNAGPDYEDTRDDLWADGWNVDYDATDTFILGPDQQGPVIAYGSYGENHSPGPVGDGTYIDGFNFAQGAIFNTYESYNGRALNRLDTLFNQEQVADFIAAGGTFGIGQVWEPFSFSLPDNEYLFVNFLVNGLTWAESAYSAIPALSWMQIVVGDPLARVERVVDQPADFDGDGDVDQSDFGIFQGCLSGPWIPQTDPPCTNTDLDGDGDVDQTDYDGFQRCFSGPAILADPNCLP